ncbi:hypothetical protein DPMN_003072 [Dreissena polymorpha]|uniref:Uncharacterized protein n=1 Tax=Dreissena polymorpha TaxID=45954 RepID=A0A9D4MKV4_DREPO|nr:hypothetical protein DPMN_003072 [Dreissena polymorpha]
MGLSNKLMLGNGKLFGASRSNGNDLTQQIAYSDVSINVTDLDMLLLNNANLTPEEQSASNLGHLTTVVVWNSRLWVDEFGVRTCSISVYGSSSRNNKKNRSLILKSSGPKKDGDQLQLSHFISIVNKAPFLNPRRLR